MVSVLVLVNPDKRDTNKRDDMALTDTFVKNIKPLQGQLPPADSGCISAKFLSNQ
jgi:hypothetical protein